MATETIDNHLSFKAVSILPPRCQQQQALQKSS